MTDMEQTEIFEIDYDEHTHSVWIDHWSSLAGFYLHINESVLATNAMAHRDQAERLLMLHK